MLDLIELKSESGAVVLVNPNAIETVHPAGKGGVRDNAYVRFMSGTESDMLIDDDSYQLLRRGLAERVGGAAGGV